MREIFFRGKRKDNGNWIKGHLHKMDGYGTGYTEYGIQEQYGECRPWSIVVIPETVGQFTGLTDKNGTRIFEGDIVRTYAREIYEIGYIEKYARFAGKRKGVVFAIFNFEKCEVIGNVHDNPELLEDAKK